MGHKLIFNGIDSSNYGVLISGEGTFATPERDITAVPVPGRNGDIHFDNGRYNNILVTYSCGISRGFESKFLPFIRALMSAPIYSRLEDTYHPEEYRLATIHAEMVPDVGTALRSGHFDLVFDCKPQRYLKAGEQEIELNLTDDMQGSLSYDVYADLDATTQAEVTALGIPTSAAFPKVTLARDADYVFLESHENGWIYPNDSTSYGYWRCSTGAYLDTGDVFHTYVTLDTSPFFSLRDEVGEILTPAYYGTKITNPTKFPAKPLIKIYGQQGYVLNTAFGIDSDNWVKVFSSDTGRVTSDRLLYVDCEDFDAYSHSRMTGEVMSFNDQALFKGELVIPPGTHTIRMSAFRATLSNIDKITITPRWWRL